MNRTIPLKSILCYFSIDPALSSKDLYKTEELSVSLSKLTLEHLNTLVTFTSVMVADDICLTRGNRLSFENDRSL